MLVNVGEHSLPVGSVFELVLCSSHSGGQLVSEILAPSFSNFRAECAGSFFLVGDVGVASLSRSPLDEEAV